MNYALICAECGKVFVSSRQRQKYCSADCCRKVENRRAIEARKLKSTIEKRCAYCGKIFYTYSDHIRFCNKSCSAQGRKANNVPHERQFETVKIKITQHLPVFPRMIPRVGAVYKAQKVFNAQYVNQTIYIIPDIGKYGLIVRESECEEVAEDVSE